MSLHKGSALESHISIEDVSASAARHGQTDASLRALLPNLYSLVSKLPRKKNCEILAV
jgi:hypothetical protein